MIVPTPRLIALTALVLLPLATLAGVTPDVSGLANILIAGFFLLVLFDAVRRLGAVDELSLAAPHILRLSKGRSGHMDITITNESNRSRR